VGKTAIVEGLAGAKYRGEFEELRYGKLTELQRRLAAEEARLAAKQGER